MFLKNTLASTAWLVHLIIFILLCLWGSYSILKYCDYGYEFLYDVLDINNHISEFGPKNYYKSDFEYLTKQEHVKLFSDIVHGVTASPETLSAITYLNKEGEAIPLLRTPEVVHLQDVYNLNNAINKIAYLLMSIFIIIGSLIYRLQFSFKKSEVLGTGLGVISIALLTIWAIGPTAIFYQFHIWVFPEGHQWFFYYQESLMSTMMKAPDLFGGIALLIILLAIPLIAACWLILNCLYKL